MFKNKHLLVITILVLLSFGQLLWMQPWQDDNALFFKLSHIAEPAGFLGKGLLGEGPYRYTAAPYYLIYKFFGYNIPLYFGLALACYFLASIAVYYLFSYLLDKKAGLLVSFLFIANYATADSFIRLFNSVSTSFSIVLLCVVIFCKWRYLKSLSWKWLSLSLISYLVLTEIAYVRVHYLIGSLILADLVFAIWPVSKRSIGKLIISLVSFMGIFAWQYILHADTRTANGLATITSLLTGHFGTLASFFSGFGYLVVPDLFLNLIPHQIGSLFKNPYYIITALNLGVLLGVCGVAFFLLRSKYRQLAWGIITLNVIWFALSRLIFTQSVTNNLYPLFFLEFIGGLVVILLSFSGSFLAKDRRKLFFFLFSVVFFNIGSYIIYDPGVFFSSYNNRYLVHSYFGLIAALVVLTTFKPWHKWLVRILITWGVLNLTLNVFSQYNIIQTRSKPIAQFHKQLHQALPSIPKEAILYFDLPLDQTTHHHFDDAITSSQMPETTAIAWRYGLDRYDFSLSTSFEKVNAILQANQSAKSSLYTFYYNEKELQNTTSQTKQLLFSGKQIKVNNLQATKSQLSKGFERLTLDFNQSIFSGVPLVMRISLTATPLSASEVASVSTDSVNKQFVTEAVSYRDFQTELRRHLSVNVSSQWQERQSKFLLDQDPNTSWQADRVLWSKQPTFLTLDLGSLQSVQQFSWVNGFSDTTPTAYQLKGSVDGQNWINLQQVSDPSKKDDGEKIDLSFPPQQVRFLKMTITKTWNNDAPAINELSIEPGQFDLVRILAYKEFLSHPFKDVSSSELFSFILTKLNATGIVNYFWKKDHQDNFQNTPNSLINVVFDGKSREYPLVIPVGGLTLTNLQLVNDSIPGTITIDSLSIEYKKQDFTK